MKKIVIDCANKTETKSEMTEEEAAALRKTWVYDYQALRATQYPAITDQLDAIMKWAALNAPDGSLKEMADRCMAVKQMFPKKE